MNRVQGVSLPRSGHHLVARVIDEYFEEAVSCNYYLCCQQIPCAHGRSYAKHHDLNLQLVRSESATYFIQFRVDPQAQFEAYYRFFVDLYRSGDTRFQVQEHFSYFDDYYPKYFAVVREGGSPSQQARAYDQFVRDHLDYYRAFVAKWVLGASHQRMLLVAYEALVDDPVAQIARLIRRLEPNHPTDLMRLQQLVANEDVRYYNRLEESPHFDTRFCERYGLEAIHSGLQGLVES